MHIKNLLPVLLDLMLKGSAVMNRSPLRLATVALVAAGGMIVLAGFNQVEVKAADAPVASAQETAKTQPKWAAINAKFFEIAGELPPDMAAALNMNRKVVVMSPNETDAWLGKLSALAGVDVKMISNPAFIRRFGEPAKMVVSTEFRYPTQNKRNETGTGWTPTDFATRNVGSELEVTVHPCSDKNIFLDARAEITHFDGFIEDPVGMFTSPAQTASKPSEPGQVVQTGSIDKNECLFQPIFTVISNSTTVVMYSGKTTILFSLGDREEVSRPEGKTGETKETVKKLKRFCLLTVTTSPPVLTSPSLLEKVFGGF